jgi:hypothetical protein
MRLSLAAPPPYDQLAILRPDMNDFAPRLVTRSINRHSGSAQSRTLYTLKHQMNKLIPALALTALCSVAHALPVAAVDHGFLTGSYFRGGSPSARNAYVIGVLDGFSYSPVFGAPDTKIDKLQDCIGTMHADAQQLGGVVDHYLDTHPESLKDRMQPVILRAMRQACASHGITID